MVQQTKRKGTTLGYAHTVGGHVSAPWPNAMQWMEQDGKGSYQEASRVKATLVYSGDEGPLATQYRLVILFVILFHRCFTVVTMRCSKTLATPRLRVVIP